MTLLPLIFTLGLIAAGTTLIVRALVPQLWLLVKPFSCDLCMSWWSSLVSMIGLMSVQSDLDTTALPAVLGGVAVSVVLLKAVNRLDV